MTKWKLFNWSKKEEISVKNKTMNHDMQKFKKKPKIPQIKKETEKTIKEYNETLYTKDYEKKPSTNSSEKTQSLKRSSWENLSTIEREVDDIRYKKNLSVNQIKKSKDTDFKVDFVLSKKKRA